MADFGDTDSRRIDSARDEHDPLGCPGDEIASGLEHVQGHEFTVHECSDDDAGRRAGAGPEPKQLVQAALVSALPRAAKLGRVSQIARRQQVESGENLPRRPLPGRREPHGLAGSPQRSMRNRVVVNGWLPTRQQGRRLRAPDGRRGRQPRNVSTHSRVP
jgi:hypothetical protein